MTVTARPRRLWGASLGLVFLLLWLVAALPASAHSDLVSSSPAAGSSVTAATGMSIVLSFSEALKKGSKADVVDGAGTTVGTATIDPGDNTKLSWTPTAPLTPGSYTIRWTSIATDGDLLRGTIPFSVTPAPPTTEPFASPSAGPTTIESPSATPSPSPAPSDASSNGATVILPVIAALVVIGVLGLVLLRSRRPTA